MSAPLDTSAKALHDDDTILVAALLHRHPDLAQWINEPIGPFGSPAIQCVRSPAMLDLLLRAGADLNAKSDWWAGGFGLLHTAPLPLAEYAITRGATVDLHAAARLGMIARLRELVSQNPELVHQRGGDGQTPLHFASSVAVANYLLDHGAEIDARDIDHESTPAQYMARDRQDVLRTLIQRGCATDLFIAAALGDADLVRKHLQHDPDAIRARVDSDHFPMVNPKAGGTIYQWTLGAHRSPHDVAREFGHHSIFRMLVEMSPPEVQLLAACAAGDAAGVEALRQANPTMTERLGEADRRQIAHAARNNHLRAVQLMLAAGLPADARGQHGGTPLHWAAWHGNHPMVEAILAHQPPLELCDDDFKSTPLGWALHGSVKSWQRENGDYIATVAALLRAGAAVSPETAHSDLIAKARNTLRI